MSGTTTFRFTSDADPDGELRKALALRRLSALDATRAGVVSADQAARMVRGTGSAAPGRHDGHTRAGGQTTAARRSLGCEVCRSPVVPAGLCDGCRRRLSMPLVDHDAAIEAAERYRAEHPRHPGDRASASGTADPAAAGGASARTEDAVVVNEEAAAAAQFALVS